MSRNIVGITVFLLVSVMLAAPFVGMAYAKQGTFVHGEQSVTGYTPIGDDPEGNSANVLSTAMLEVTWTGDIDGVATYEGILMVHSMDPVSINIHEKIFFPTVTVLDKTGSLTLQVSANLGRGQDVFRWTITDGTGELANLHGNGIYWLENIATGLYLYEGQVHFDP
jgi:hypothetical protein